MTQHEMANEPTRILIVDDEEAARYGMRRAITLFANDIAEADSVLNARAQLANARLDLIVLDANLPHKS